MFPSVKLVGNVKKPHNFQTLFLVVIELSH